MIGVAVMLIMYPLMDVIGGWNYCLMIPAYAVLIIFDVYAFRWAGVRRGCVFGVPGGRKCVHLEWTEVLVP